MEKFIEYLGRPDERFVTVVFKDRKLVFISHPLHQSDAERMAMANGVLRGFNYASKIVSVKEGEKLRQQLPEPLEDIK